MMDIWNYFQRFKEPTLQILARAVGLIAASSVGYCIKRRLQSTRNHSTEETNLDDGTLAATEVATEEMPKMENTPVGSKPKKMKRVQAFIRQAWKSVKQTFHFSHRSNKISPYN